MKPLILFLFILNISKNTTIKITIPPYSLQMQGSPLNKTVKSRSYFIKIQKNYPSKAFIKHCSKTSIHDFHLSPASNLFKNQILSILHFYSAFSFNSCSKSNKTMRTTNHDILTLWCKPPPNTYLLIFIPPNIAHEKHI